MILKITVTIKRPTLPRHPSPSTGFVANAPIRMRAVIQGPSTFVRHPTQSARRWWFLSPLPRRRQSLCAFASQHAPPVLPLTCPLQMRRRLWHPRHWQSLCALANQRATPVLSLICPIQMRRRLWHPPRSIHQPAPRYSGSVIDLSTGCGIRVAGKACVHSPASTVLLRFCH
jgi:hypothetical protein